MTETTEKQAMARVRNVLIAIVAISLSVTLFLGLRSEDTAFSLDTQAESSMPLEVALTNGKPTLMEFYANWCTSCQAMAKDLGELKQQYSDSVNFVMLNVDNSKWLPEMLRYRVDGIPHFVFLNSEGNAIAQTIGEQPHSILEANLNALVASSPLPYIQSNGRVSEFEARVKPTPDDPRTHSSQIKG